MTFALAPTDAAERGGAILTPRSGRIHHAHAPGNLRTAHGGTRGSRKNRRAARERRSAVIVATMCWTTRGATTVPVGGGRVGGRPWLVAGARFWRLERLATVRT